MVTEKRILGKTDLQTAPIVFGGNVFGWTVDEKQSFELLDHFISLGFNFIDTANSYSRWKPGNKGGESETIIGNWLKKRGQRHDVVIATKVGSDMGAGKQLKKNHIITEAEQSLKRLQTDYIDLYFSHHDDLNVTVEEPLIAYEQLIKEGKVRWIGASNFSPERLKAALIASHENNLPQYQVLQPEYNLYDRTAYEKQYQKLASDFNLGVVPYYSLASGFLTGKYRSESDLGQSLRGDGIKKYLNDKGFKILDALNEVAENHHINPAAVALAWLIHQPTITAPIASATNLAQLDSFEKAVNLKLSSEELSLLQTASS